MKAFIALVVVLGGLLTLAAVVGPQIAQNSAPVALGAHIEQHVEAEKGQIPGRPLTAVAVTQCNALLAVYLTMPSGELVRFDVNSGLPWATVLDMANTASRSERIEISCSDEGVEGYENPVAPAV